jgi:hypothetical protein
MAVEGNRVKEALLLGLKMDLVPWGGHVDLPVRGFLFLAWVVLDGKGAKSRDPDRFPILKLSAHHPNESINGILG